MLVLSKKQEETVIVGGLASVSENTWRFCGTSRRDEENSDG